MYQSAKSPQKKSYSRRPASASSSFSCAAVDRLTTYRFKGLVHVSFHPCVRSHAAAACFCNFQHLLRCHGPPPGQLVACRLPVGYSQAHWRHQEMKHLDDRQLSFQRLNVSMRPGVNPRSKHSPKGLMVLAGGRTTMRWVSDRRTAMSRETRGVSAGSLGNEDPREPTWCSEDSIQRSVSGRPCSEPSVLKSAPANASRSCASSPS